MTASLAVLPGAGIPKDNESDLDFGCALDALSSFVSFFDQVGGSAGQRAQAATKALSSARRLLKKHRMGMERIS